MAAAVAAASTSMAAVAVLTPKFSVRSTTYCSALPYLPPRFSAKAAFSTSFVPLSSGIVFLFFIFIFLLRNLCVSQFVQFTTWQFLLQEFIEFAYESFVGFCVWIWGMFYYFI